jgi:hypothetical protein
MGGGVAGAVVNWLCPAATRARTLELSWAIFDAICFDLLGSEHSRKSSCTKIWAHLFAENRTIQVGAGFRRTLMIGIPSALGIGVRVHTM